MKHEIKNITESIIRRKLGYSLLSNVNWCYNSLEQKTIVEVLQYSQIRTMMIRRFAGF